MTYIANVRERPAKPFTRVIVCLQINDKQWKNSVVKYLEVADISFVTDIISIF